MGLRILTVTPDGLVRIRLERKGDLTNVTVEKMEVSLESERRGKQRVEAERVVG